MVDTGGLFFQKSLIQKGKFNTIFIGSSRTEFGISPGYFDSLTKYHTRSYNLGIPHGLPPGTIQRCENLLQNHVSLKFIFFELSGETPTYKRTLKDFTFRSYYQTASHWTFKQSNSFHNNSVLNVFKPSNWMIEIPIMNNRVNLFENSNNISAEANRVKQINLSYQRNLRVENVNNVESSPMNELYWKRILKLIALAEAKKIRIYFFIPPRIETDNEVRTIYPLYQKLDTKYKLKAAHYEESLYKINTSIDDFHLNQKGAMRFTELMAEAFIKQCKDFK